MFIKRILPFDPRFIKINLLSLILLGFYSGIDNIREFIEEKHWFKNVRYCYYMILFLGRYLLMFFRYKEPIILVLRVETNKMV